VLIAGGADKDSDFTAWAKAAKQYVSHIIFFDGAGTERMEKALIAQKARTPAFTARNMREAIHAARHVVEKGGIVLLSPACASFGVFKNAVERGAQFDAQVKKPHVAHH
jgi:UDP-N-acetylmuramoylalanine--D-glutamate ligase